MAKHARSKNNLLKSLVGKKVTVEADRIEVEGRLVHVQLGNKSKHLPILLVLNSPQGHMILRDWGVIKWG